MKIVRKSNMVIGSIAVVITVLIFMLGVQDKQSADYISLAFILFAEISATVGTAVGKVSDLESWALTVIFIGYVLICTVAALVSGRRLAQQLNTYLLIQIILIALTAAAVCITHVIAAHNREYDDRAATQISLMRGCETLARNVYMNADPKYRDGLRGVYEAVKYTDKVSDANTAEIMAALEDLRAAVNGGGDKEKEIGELSRKVIALADERTEYNKSMKHGNF